MRLNSSYRWMPSMKCSVCGKTKKQDKMRLNKNYQWECINHDK